MSSTPVVYRILNPIMKSLLKSPIHSVVSEKIMIITFTGRKSGKQYSTPVSYFRENDSVYCFTHGGWWRNIKDGAHVTLRIQGAVYRGFAEAITEDNVRKSRVLAKMLRDNPREASIYHVSLDANGEPDNDEVDKAALDAVMIRTALDAA
jgi:deazaflavin-dependent oxidoreductase (nitroreductase family)